jgi:ribosomal protein S18 acetylase RimI-like enzyme
MKEGDLDSIIRIDSKVSGQTREVYYKRKMTEYLNQESNISVSLVADHKDQTIGFIMGNLYTGEFGVPETIAFLDTIGIDPNYQKSGIGNMLLEKFQTHLKALGVNSIQTLVDWEDQSLVSFFSRTGFTPHPTLNLEKKI